MRFGRLLGVGVALFGVVGASAEAGYVDLIVDAWAVYDVGQPSEYRVQIRDGGDPSSSGTCADPLLIQPGALPDAIWFGVAVATDGTLGLGTGTVVYDVVPCEGGYIEPGYTMDQMHDAATGWSDGEFGGVHPKLSYVVDPYYEECWSCWGSEGGGYWGGWGHNAAGLYHEGYPDGGSILSPSLQCPLKWIADANPSFVGNQPEWKNDVGLGTYMLEGPYGAGHMGGFGQDLSNKNNIIDGDGHWFFQESVIDLSGWDIDWGETVGWKIDLRSAAVMNATLDYNEDIDGGFLVYVPGIPEEGLYQDSFAFMLDYPGCTCGDVDESGGPVDLADFGLFALCYGYSAPTGDCAAEYFYCSDLDGSGTVELYDFGLFALWYGQSSSQHPPGCQPECWPRGLAWNSRSGAATPGPPSPTARQILISLLFLLNEPDR